MDEKAQGSFEYILMLGGVLLLVSIVYVIIRSDVLEGGKHTVNQSYNQWENATNTSGYL